MTKSLPCLPLEAIHCFFGSTWFYRVLISLYQCICEGKIPNRCLNFWEKYFSSR